MADPLNQFLAQYWRDVDASAHHALEHYLQEHPEVPPEVLAAEYAALSATVVRSPEELRAEALSGRLDASHERTTLGRFRELVLVGEGGQARVYRAYDPKIDRLVALKVFEHPTSELSRSIQKELRHTVSLGEGRSDICQVFEVDQEGDCLFVVLNYVEGRTLHDYLEDARWKDGPGPIELPGPGTPLERVLRCTAEVACALHYAHTRPERILHLDVKPGNVMMRADGRPVLLDFGIAASSLDAAHPGPAGTPAYMSPEQWLEVPDLDARTDVYALGVTLYEMLSVERPFDLPSKRHTGHAILIGPRFPLRTRFPEAPADLESVLAKCLARDRDERYPTALALQKDIEALLKGERPSAHPTRAARLRAWLSAHPAWTLALGALALGLLLLPPLGLLISGQGKDLAFERELRRLRHDGTHLAAEVRGMGEEGVEWLGTTFQPWTGDVTSPTRWLADADRLLASRAAIEQRRDAQRARALPYTTDDQEADKARNRRLAPELHEQIRYHLDVRTELQGRLAITDDKPKRDGLLARVAETQRVLDALLSHPIAQARWTFRFEDQDDAARHADLERALDQLERLAAERTRVVRIREVALLAAERWSRFQDLEANGLLRRGVTPQALPGFVPLMRAGENGAWDFWYARSGPLPAITGSLDDGRVTPSARSGLVFRSFRSGTSRMGRDDPDAPDEGPPHDVPLGPWLHARTRVSVRQRQWMDRALEPAAVAPPARRADPDDASSALMNWIDARRWLEPHGFDVATEAQWEAAARLAQKTQDLIPDLVGDAWDWCRDSYAPYTTAATGPEGLREGPAEAPRVVRGPPRRDARSPSSTYRGTLGELSDAGVRPVRRLAP